ncbi:MAG: ComF family protein [Candidatus Cohnella colombiensis]|uniref:ComF family protein n=1 Tax=Candidatus Cohnella colombiensis TaxID=3121368 RepID=A0AA95EV15_9BACL|nr:MAG: ComF family protein [Cohnella sp.]
MLNKLTALFASIEQRCPLCGGRPQHNGMNTVPIAIEHPAPRKVLEQLCKSCLSQIPWIAKPICNICGRHERCEDCVRRATRYVELCRCAVKYDDRMREWLALYKYRGQERLEALLAAMLAFAFERLCASVCQRPVYFQAITCVPLASERLRERGFNQAERMAIHLSHWYGIPYRPMLYRQRHTEKQSLKSRRSRVEDMSGLFSPIQKVNNLERIILLDDIYTTGSTMNECARVLSEGDGGRKNTQIYGISWARS